MMGNGVEKTWPPEDMQWTLEDLGTWSKTGTVVNGFGSSVSFTSNAFEDLIHLSGLPTLHLLSPPKPAKVAKYLLLYMTTPAI